MPDRFDLGEEVVLDPFGVLYDKSGKPVGIAGWHKGEQIMEMGEVEMPGDPTSKNLSHIHVQQAARRICCKNGVCKRH